MSIPKRRERILHLTRDDFKWEYFRIGGKGGQKRDKTSAGVRCVHPPSNAKGQSTEHRSQAANRKAAFRKCAESVEFQTWIKVEHARVLGRRLRERDLELQINAAVEKAMAEENLLIEYGPFE